MKSTIQRMHDRAQADADAEIERLRAKMRRDSRVFWIGLMIIAVLMVPLFGYLQRLS